MYVSDQGEEIGSVIDGLTFVPPLILSYNNFLCLSILLTDDINPLMEIVESIALHIEYEHIRFVINV